MSGLVTTLFISAFVSATLLPGSSEAVLFGVLASNKVPIGVAIETKRCGPVLSFRQDMGVKSWCNT